MKKWFHRFCSGLLCLALMLSMLPQLTAPVQAETGYDRGYPAGMPGSGQIVAHGLDVSAWQESGLNFQNIANAGYKYVILRCGTSVRKDVCFEEYYNSARAAGLDIGCYFYSYALDKATAQQEAWDVINWISGKVFEYPVYFDFEDPTQIDLSYSLSADICRGFMDVLKDNGYLAGLYSMSWILNRDWVASSGIRDTYEGWVAHVYSDANNTGITSGQFNIYKDRYASVYGMHQYSFTTYVNGVGPFDANVAYKNYPELVKAYGFNGYDGSGNHFGSAKPLYMGEDFMAYIRNSATGKYITDVNNNLELAEGQFGTGRDDFYSSGTQLFHFYRNDDGTYSICNDAKGKWFDVAGGVYRDGTNMQLWTGNGLNTQKFYIYFVNGNFYFRCKSSDRVIDADLATNNLQLCGNSPGDTEASQKARAFEILKMNMDYSHWYRNFGNEATVYVRNLASGKLMSASDSDVSFTDPKYTNDQKWQVKRKVDGSYEFVNVATGKYLDVTENGIEIGTQVDTWEGNGQKNQSFYILPTDTPGYNVIKPVYTDNVLDMAADSGNLALYAPNLDSPVPRAAQLFEIVFTGVAENTLPPVRLEDQFRAIITNNQSGNALTDLGNGTLEARTPSQASNQIFTFRYDAATDAYEIVGSSGKAVEVSGAGYQNETVIGMAQRNDWASQRFRLHEVDGGYVISPIYTNLLVDVHGENNTTVQLYGTTVATNRTFTLELQANIKIELTANTDYTLTDTLVRQVAPATTVTDLLTQFVNDDLVVQDINGNPLTGSDLAGTGTTVNLYSGSELLDSVTLVVLGDVDGSGEIDHTDYLRIKSALVNSFRLERAPKAAADVDSSGKVNTTDYLQMKAYFLHLYNPYD